MSPDGSFRFVGSLRMSKPDLMRRTKIVATIGPATESPERLRELIAAGATTFRLNFSHGDHSEHAARIITIRQVAEELGIHVGILQDLQGPKIRLGRFGGGPITLANGDPFILTSREVAGDHTIATVTYDQNEQIPMVRIGAPLKARVAPKPRTEESERLKQDRGSVGFGFALNSQNIFANRANERRQPDRLRP